MKAFEDYMKCFLKASGGYQRLDGATWRGVGWRKPICVYNDQYRLLVVVEMFDRDSCGFQGVGEGFRKVCRDKQIWFCKYFLKVCWWLN